MSSSCASPDQSELESEVLGMVSSCSFVLLESSTTSDPEVGVDLYLLGKKSLGFDMNATSTNRCFIHNKGVCVRFAIGCSCDMVGNCYGVDQKTRTLD